MNGTHKQIFIVITQTGTMLSRILAHCGYGFRVHIGQYLTNQLLHCLPVYPWRSRGLRCFRAIHNSYSGSRR